MSKKPTYLVVTPFFPSSESFVGNYVFDQINEIRNQTDYNIEIIKVVSVFSSEKDYIYKSFNVSIFKMIDFPFFIFPGIFHFINKWRFHKFLQRKSVCNIKVAHAHVTYPSSYLISDLACQRIAQHHGLDVLQLLNGRNAIIRNIQRKYLIKRSIDRLNKVDVNVGVSRKVLKELNAFEGYQSTKDLVLYNGVDTNKFYPIPLEKENRFLTIGCIANFWKLKDQITLIKSVQLLKEKGVITLVRFIGSGRTLKKCIDYVSRNKLTDIVVFEKEKQHDMLNDFYNQIDIFVLPSYYEALGCVYLESWATNTPFIAVKGQGVEEVIPTHLKERLLIRKSDELDLSNKISSFHTKKLIIEFDKRYSIKETIKEFLNHDILLNR